MTPRSRQKVRTARSQPVAAKQRFWTDAGLVIMAALIGGIDPAEARVERETNQTGGLVLLPRRAVDEARHADALDVGVADGAVVAWCGGAAHASAALLIVERWSRRTTS